MSRDPGRLEPFVMADALVIDLYKATKAFPIEERFGLQSQLRRAAVSVPTNLVEGSARRSTRNYLHFVEIAIGSASELRYLVGVAVRLGFMTAQDADSLVTRYGRVIRALQALVSALPEARGPRPEAHNLN
jgi:four helix bundle protein